jgi:hypothetical protein
MHRPELVLQDKPSTFQVSPASYTIRPNMVVANLLDKCSIIVWPNLAPVHEPFCSILWVDSELHGGTRPLYTSSEFETAWCSSLDSGWRSDYRLQESVSICIDGVQSGLVVAIWFRTHKRMSSCTPYRPLAKIPDLTFHVHVPLVSFLLSGHSCRKMTTKHS